MSSTPEGVVARNVRRLARLDIPGGGQVTVQGDLAFIGHISPPEGTTILDVSDPENPRIVSRIDIDSFNHSHKVRVHGDIMLVNCENNRRHQMQAAARMPAVRKELEARWGRPPDDVEVARELNYTAAELPLLEEAARRGPYKDGGLRIYSIADPARPREIGFFPVGGNGVHRFDFDGRYAYISAGMEGFRRNIVVIVDLVDPAKPREVSRWWIPGQWAEGGETPDWGDLRYECHHPLRFGDRLYVSYHAGGAVILDIADIENPKLLSHYNYHPALVASTHTYARLSFPLGGRDVAVVVDEQSGRPKWPGAGHVPGFMWVFDVTDETDPRPISTYCMSEEDTPWRRGTLGSAARFGAHQCHERMRDSLVYLTWFRGGLRIVDIADPTKPREVGHFIPTPGPGQKTVMSNDVYVDERGLIYLIDRHNGLDILQYTGEPGYRPH